MANIFKLFFFTASLTLAGTLGAGAAGAEAPQIDTATAAVLLEGKVTKALHAIKADDGRALDEQRRTWRSKCAPTPPRNC
jgi:hypothetical protein